jgi:hypothetical protein
MKYFQVDENILSYLYMHHICFKLTTSMCKKHELMKNDFHTISIIKLWDGKFVMKGPSSQFFCELIWFHKSEKWLMIGNQGE